VAHEGDDMILAGDIGGTKTNLALFKPGSERPRAEERQRFETGAYDDPADLIKSFLKDYQDQPITAACLAVAGPVVDGRSQLTNVPWTLSQEDLARRFGWHHCRLLNDMEATVQAIPLLKASETASLQGTGSVSQGTLGILAPGTGLGTALAIRRDGELFALASEAGHSDFAPCDEDGLSLWRYVTAREGHACLEHVLSGPGLQRIYEWRRHLGDVHPDSDTAQTIAASDDPSARISSLGLEGLDPVCARVLDDFVRYLGAAAGNLALTAMARGGIYLAGGIAPKILPKLQEGPFLKAFCDKTAFGDLLKTIPVEVILTGEAPLLGAAKVAMEVG
jgi:glucokinase